MEKIVGKIYCSDRQYGLLKKVSIILFSSGVDYPGQFLTNSLTKGKTPNTLEEENT